MNNIQLCYFTSTASFNIEVAQMTVAMTELQIEKQHHDLKNQCQVRERSTSPLIKIEGLAYMVLFRPDIEKAAKFFVDYGLLLDKREEETIYLRGLTTEHHLIIIRKGPQEVATIGLKASETHVETLAQEYGQPIKTHPEPMGGKYVTLIDPNGLTVEVNCNLTPLIDVKKEDIGAQWNNAGEKLRVNEPMRNPISPLTVQKLGHSLYSVANFKKTVHWYQDTFGMIVSDFQMLPGDDMPIVAFMRCDKGDVPSDHHTLGFAVAPELGHSHSAFEMDTFEEVAIAKEWMSHRDSDLKYKHGWGIGRHVLGSQVFDYWRDPFGDMFEHYADSDLFSDTKQAGYHLFSGTAQHQWGPEMTNEFKGLNRRWETVKNVFKRLPTKDDLTLSKLLKMMKAI
ncbi:hypothetical protein A9Q81_14255 [Gammaproteobacteria bacterium 42_54_T18]|nr:hypothetical protein A9Q81_14255 [Gammaproteobacteria bacterium 42_54_T18]